MQMTLKEGAHILDQLQVGGVDEVGLFWVGEPGIDQRMPEWIRMVASRGMKPFITTNGTALPKKKAREWFEAGLWSLKFSLNFPDAASFAKGTSSDPRLFNLIEQNMRTAKKARDEVERATGHRCQLSSSIIRFSDKWQGAMTSVVNRVKDHVDHFYYLAPYRIEENNLTREELDDGMVLAIGNPGRFENPHPVIPCHILFRFFVVDVHGNLSGCAFHHGTNADKFVAGNLFTENLLDVWHSKVMRDLRLAHLVDWKNGDEKLTCSRRTACGPCLTPPANQDGLMPGQALFLKR